MHILIPQYFFYNYIISNKTCAKQEKRLQVTKLYNKYICLENLYFHEWKQKIKQTQVW